MAATRLALFSSKRRLELAVNQADNEINYIYMFKEVQMENQTGRFRAAAGKVGKVVFARLLPGCDLIGGLQRICQENDIKGGNVVLCIGSLREVALHVQGPEDASGMGPLVRIPGPVDLLNCQGTISESEGKGMVIHLHGLVCNDKQVVYGGHLVKGEAIVAATMEVVVNGVEGMKVLRKYDSQAKEEHLFPEEA